MYSCTHARHEGIYKSAGISPLSLNLTVPLGARALGTQAIDATIGLDAME
jgi:hypothetical protein